MIWFKEIFLVFWKFQFMICKSSFLLFQRIILALIYIKIMEM